MTVLTWIVRFAIFIFLVVFAVQNTEPVTLRLLPAQAWEMPLVIALLAAFIGGIVLGLLSLLGVLFRQRREIARLKRASDRPATPAAPEVPPVL